MDERSVTATETPATEASVDTQAPVGAETLTDTWVRDRLRRDAAVLDARSLRGRPVMDLSEGRQVGTVSDVVLDTEGERLVGLSVSRPGALPALAKQNFLPFYRLRAIGEDAVTMDHDNWLEPPLSRDAASVTAPGRALEGKRAVTRTGDYIGTMQDVVFNPVDGRIAAYAVDAADGARTYMLWTRGVLMGEDVIIVPDEARTCLLRDRGGPGATWEAYRRQGMEDNPLTTGSTESTVDISPNEDASMMDDTGTTDYAGITDYTGTVDASTEPGSPLSESDDRLDTEFQYVIGHIARKDVIVDGQVVVPAGTEVTAADAAAALAAGALEDLAFAVGSGDYSKMDVHGRPDPVDQTPDTNPTV